MPVSLRYSTFQGAHGVRKPAEHSACYGEAEKRQGSEAMVWQRSHPFARLFDSTSGRLRLWCCFVLRSLCPSRQQD
jgi:hypothetical protein